jgi:hypothetical protein
MVAEKTARNVRRKKKTMNNPVAYSEMKVRAIVNAVQKKLDKNQKDY